MTQEDKQLLLQDLSARLPYKVCINDCGTPYRLVNICWDGIKFVVNSSPFGTGHGRIGTPLFDGDVCCIKPYLRSMSSMTEEEHNEWFNYYHEIELKEAKSTGDYLKAAILGESASIDWLNKNMFDYRGLIPKDLAISTEVFNPYNKD